MSGRMIVNSEGLLVLLLERQKAGQTRLTRYVIGKIKKYGEILMTVLINTKIRKFYVSLLLFNCLKI